MSNVIDYKLLAAKAIRDAEKPRLIINSGDLPATAKELAGYFAAGDHFLSNGNCPVMIVTNDGVQRAIEVTSDCVRTVAHELTRPVKLRPKDELIDVTLSKDIAQLYLLGLIGQWGLKTFRGITTAPILENDGSIRIVDGYDAKSGLWAHNIPELAIPAQPSEQDVRAALHQLRYFFRTFPFADSERVTEDGIDVTDLSKEPALDESIFLVALLTAVARQSLDLAPGVLCDAPSFSGAGTGKGLLIKATVIVASGTKPSAFTSGHDPEEFDKRLTAALVEARPAVFLDNFNGKDLKSDILASALTENPAMVRIMGHTKTVPLHTRTFIGITGNGVQIAEDMARRILKVDLDAKMENPEQRPFRPGFLESAFANRAGLLSAALTIWRWGRQNELKNGRPIGSYELWAQWCRDPLLTLGCKDPVERIAEIKAADPHRAALVDLFELWWTIHGDFWVKAADIDDKINERIDQKSKRKDDGTLTYNRQYVARYLGQHAGTCVGGYILHRQKDPNRTRPHYSYKLQLSKETVEAADQVA